MLPRNEPGLAVIPTVPKPWRLLFGGAGGTSAGDLDFGGSTFGEFIGVLQAVRLFHRGRSGDEQLVLHRCGLLGVLPDAEEDTD